MPTTFPHNKSRAHIDITCLEFFAGGTTIFSKPVFMYRVASIIPGKANTEETYTRATDTFGFGTKGDKNFNERLYTLIQ